MSIFNYGSFLSLYPVTEMSMSDIVDAFRIVQLRKHTGKLVLTIDENTKVRQFTTIPAKLKLHSSGAYLIYDGEYELVMSTCKFMANHGAKNILLLASPLSGDANDKILAESTILGLDIEILNIHAGDSTSLASHALDLQNRGVILCGVVQFTVCIFWTTSHSNWILTSLLAMHLGSLQQPKPRF